MLEKFLKNCSLWEGSMFKKVVKDCLPWVRPHTGAGEEREEEGEAETKCYELTAISLVGLGHLGGEGRRVGSQVVPGKK